MNQALEPYSGSPMEGIRRARSLSPALSLHCDLVVDVNSKNFKMPSMSFIFHLNSKVAASHILLSKFISKCLDADLLVFSLLIIIAIFIRVFLIT